MKRLKIDSYVVDTLMADLVGHDRQPSAFLVYLHLLCRSDVERSPVAASHQAIAKATGLSKSAVQGAIRTLRRRKLIQSSRATITAVPTYVVLRPWTA